MNHSQKTTSPTNTSSPKPTTNTGSGSDLEQKYNDGGSGGNKALDALKTLAGAVAGTAGGALISKVSGMLSGNAGSKTSSALKNLISKKTTK